MESLTAALEIGEIIGVLKHVRSQGNEKTMTVFSLSSQKSYTIQCPFYCHAKAGDLVTGYCFPKEHGEYQFLQAPLVEMAVSKEAIQTAFIVAMGRLKMPQYLSDKLYDFFKKEALDRIEKLKQNLSENKDHTDYPIYRNRHDLNGAIMEMISWYSFAFRTDPGIMRPIVNLGLSEEQARKLLNWWYQERMIRRLYLLGLTKQEIREACQRGWSNREFGIEHSPSALYYQLMENPYLVEKLPMEKAHEISKRYQLSFDQNMMEAADLVRFVESQCVSQGWACYPVYALMRRYTRFRELEETLKYYFKAQIRYNFFYLRHQAQVEETLCQHLESKEFHPKTHASEQTKKKLCPEQVAAVENCLNNTVSVITGKGGSGKSSSIAQLTYELELRGINYCIASFTGKAIARIKEIVGKTQNIMTLHMFLSKTLDVPFEYLIIDETSMVPNELLAKLLVKFSNALPEGKRLKVVMVGDDNQIPPIEWGDLFNQVLESKAIPRIHLKEDHRRANPNGVLFKNVGQFSTEGDPKQIEFEWGQDCQFIKGGLAELESLIYSIHSEGISHTNITIVSPYKDLDEVNQICQRIFLPKETPTMVDSFGKTWKVGARVMMTDKNFYDLNVMNGDEGIVIEVNNAANYIRVQFRNGADIKIPTYLPQIFDDYEKDEPLSTKYLSLSWAVTIHKSQGSEWREVIYWLSSRSSSGFHNRKLLYTGISRTKVRLHVVAGSESNFLNAIYQDPPTRYDNLAKRLRKEPFVDHYVDPNQQRILEMMKVAK